MRIVDLTLIADRRSPTSRAYLRYLARHGLGVRKILLVDFVSEPPYLPRVRRWLGASVAFRVLQRVPASAAAHGDLFRQLCWDMQEGQDERIDYFGPFPFEDHAAETERVVATSFADPGFVAFLLRQRTRVFLYTDGGLVPATVAEHARLRILHVHPGVVPWVRGSDCLMWSLLARGRPGASCFYMNGGIDAGPVIMTKEFGPPRFPALGSHLPQHAALLYQALLHSYDPHLRAQLFLDVATRYVDADWAHLPATPQPPDEARNYYWMHPRLREKILREAILC